MHRGQALVRSGCEYVHPSLDNPLDNVADGNQTSIFFAGEVDLDESQLSILGLS